MYTDQKWSNTEMSWPQMDDSLEMPDAVDPLLRSEDSPVLVAAVFIGGTRVSHTHMYNDDLCTYVYIHINI